jgi:hypothetical protein
MVLVLAVTASAQAPPTVWHALGIPQGWARFRDATANRRGNHPNLERKPPLKGLADPANLASDVPAIKAAAEIKAQQDLAPQKIKAIKYLGQIGCGCYGGVAEALAAALEDCTEVVRLAAAEALGEALSGKCDVCESTCCTPALAAKMYERAYGRDENGCYLEPSERVRSALAQAVAACPPTDGTEGSIIVPSTDDTRGISPIPPVVPNIEDRPAGTFNFPSRGSEIDPLAPGLLQYDALPGEDRGAAASSRRGQPTPAGRGASLPADGRTPATGIGFHPPAPSVAMMPIDVCGEVIDTRSAKGFIRVVFADNRRPPVGTELEVYHQYVLGTEFAGTLVIRDYEGHHAIAVQREWDRVKVTRGDHVECMMQVPVSESPALPSPPTVSTVQQEPTPARPPVVVAKPVAPAAPPTARPAARASAATPRESEPAEADVQASLASFDAAASIARATSSVERIFTLSTEKAARQPTAAKSTAPSAISKAAPAARSVSATSANSAPAPIVKPDEVTRPARAVYPAAGTSPLAAASRLEPQEASPKTEWPGVSPGVSSALAEMLRLPSQQAAPQSRPATSTSAAPVSRPVAGVVPASATLPAAGANSGIERLPPIVSPTEAYRSR